MQKPVTTTLPADLPENWQINQAVSPSGTDVGLTAKHGYNYQSQQINAAQRAINLINAAFENIFGKSDTVPVSSGGTGVTTKEAGNAVFTSMGLNAAPAADLPTNYPVGVFVYQETDVSKLPYKPSTYGLLFSIKVSNDITQLWFSQATGAILRRSGNSAGWNGQATVPANRGWIQVLTKSDLPTVDDIIPTTLAIAKGGTGASTAKAARVNLGVDLVTETRTIYVSTTGNDTTGTGTSGAPYKTIAKALSTLPKNLNGFECTIYLTAGTYAENVTIQDFFGRGIILSGASGTTVNISGLYIQNCSVLVSNIHLGVGNQGIYVGPQAMLYCATGTIAVNGAAEAVTLRYGAVLEVTTTLTINNASSRGLQVQYASKASIATLAGSGNAIGVYAYHGHVFVRNMTLTATTHTINENSVINVGGAVG